MVLIFCSSSFLTGSGTNERAFGVTCWTIFSTFTLPPSSFTTFRHSSLTWSLQPHSVSRSRSRSFNLQKQKQTKRKSAKCTNKSISGFSDFQSNWFRQKWTPKFVLNKQSFVPNQITSTDIDSLTESQNSHTKKERANKYGVLWNIYFVRSPCKIVFWSTVLVRVILNTVPMYEHSETKQSQR